MTTHERAQILVVDDDMPIRQLLVEVLRDDGHTVVEAMNGAHALHVLEHKSVDLVISDVMMPLLDGISLCKRVKAMGGVAVILMSSAPPPTPLNAGEDAFLSKPFDLATVEQVIEAVLATATNDE